MFFKRILATLLLSLVAYASAAAGQNTVTFFFNPGNFYDFLPLDSGPVDTFSTDGGMFKLHEIFGPDSPTETTLRSWQVSDRQNIDDWSDSLSANEGIGFFNIDLTLSANSQAWGQGLSTPVSVDRVFAPLGWTGEIDGSKVAWTTPSSAFYVRPDTAAYDDGRSFGFQFTTNDAIPLGAEETIWFGGFNFFGFDPAITFGTWGPPGFDSVDAAPGTGYEATVSLERNYIESDFDDNGIVDENDFLLWQTGFGIGSGAAHLDGDANVDGAVDGNDFLIWQTQFETAVPGSGSVSDGGNGAVAAVPEPASLLLILGSSTLLLAARRRV